MALLQFSLQQAEYVYETANLEGEVCWLSELLDTWIDLRRIVWGRYQIMRTEHSPIVHTGAFGIREEPKCRVDAYSGLENWTAEDELTKKAFEQSCGLVA